jgi:PEGA domain-containing protein
VDVGAGVGVGVVDLRAPGADPELRERVAAAVGATADPALAAALAGEEDPGPARAAEAELGRKPCAEGVADALILAGTDLDAAGGAAPSSRARALLERALGAELTCADRHGDAVAARRAANELRALRGVADAPAGVSREVWARYPELDAGVAQLREPLTVETEPPGARVWIDLGAAGAAPVRRSLASGRHRVIAEAPGHARAVTWIDLEDNRAAHVKLALAAARPDPWADVRARVAGWRAAGSAAGSGSVAGSASAAASLVGAGEIAALLDGTRLAVVVTLLPDGAAEVWAGPRRALATSQLSDLPDAVTGAQRLAAAGPMTLPAAPPAAPAPARRRRPLWVYVMAGGIAAVAVGAVLLAGTGTSTQRIEVRWP